MNLTKFCPYCKGEINIDSRECPKCGNKIETEIDYDTSLEQMHQIRHALCLKYNILQEIGRGGMATVYKGIRINDQTQIALKVVHPNLTHDHELLKRFHREALLTSHMQHPNIIKIFEEGVENKIHYIAMEYLEGIDLFSQIKNYGPILPEDLISILLPIIKALDYAHKKGLVHRDVKSANIFITRNKRPVLMDFGIAHAIQGTQLTMNGTILGTPEYMSPEQAEGINIDARTDIYSLGVVMYHALTGRLPFQSDNPITTIYKIIHENYIPLNKLKDVPEWLENVIDACLEKDCQRRITSSEELIYSLMVKEKYRFKNSETNNNSKTLKISIPDSIDHFSSNYSSKSKRNYIGAQSGLNKRYSKIAFLVFISGCFLLLALIIIVITREKSINEMNTKQENSSSSKINLQENKVIISEKKESQEFINVEKKINSIKKNPYSEQKKSNTQKELIEKDQSEILNPDRNRFKHLVSEGDKNFNNGNYSEALKYYIQAREIDKDNMLVNIKIAKSQEEIKKK